MARRMIEQRRQTPGAGDYAIAPPGLARPIEVGKARAICGARIEARRFGMSGILKKLKR
jgi:hypothetical protein